MMPSRLSSVLRTATLSFLVGASGLASADQPSARTLVAEGGQVLIDGSGSYVLQRGFVARDDRPAIHIKADGVTLDLGGHEVFGPGGKRGIGLLVEGASRVRVVNGSLARFGIGAQVMGSNAVTLRSVQISGEDLGGTPPDVEIGVLILGSRGVVLEESTVSRTFLGVFVRGGASGGNRIAGNTLVAGANGGLGICYNPAPGRTDDGPSGDLVCDNLIARFGKGIQTSVGTAGNTFRDNVVAQTGETGIEEKAAASNTFVGNVVQRIQQ